MMERGRGERTGGVEGKKGGSRVGEMREKGEAKESQEISNLRYN